MSDELALARLVPRPISYTIEDQQAARTRTRLKDGEFHVQKDNINVRKRSSFGTLAVELASFFWHLDKAWKEITAWRLARQSQFVIEWL